MVHRRTKASIAMLALLSLCAFAPAPTHAQEQTAAEKRAAEAAKYWAGQNVETLQKDGTWTKATITSIRGEIIKVKMNDWDKTTATKSPDQIRVPPSFPVGKTIRWKDDGKILYGDVTRDDSYWVHVKIGTREVWLTKSSTTFLTPTVVTRPADATDGDEEPEQLNTPFRPGEPVRYMGWGSKPAIGTVSKDDGHWIYFYADGSQRDWITRSQTLHGPQPLPKTGKGSDIQAIDHQGMKQLDLAPKLDNAPAYNPAQGASPQISNTAPIPLTGPTSPDGLVVAMLVRLTDKTGVAIAWESPGERTSFVQIVDTASHKAGPILPLPKPGTPLAFSPDGSRLATCHRGTITIWDISAATPSSVVQFDPYGRERYFNPALDSISFAANDRLVLIASKHSTAILEIKPDSVRSLFGFLTESPFAAVLSPNGKTLAVTDSTNKGILLFETATGRAIARYNAPGIVQEIDFSPDGNRLSAVCSNALAVWDLTDRRTLFQGPLQRGTTGPALSIDPAFILLNDESQKRVLMSTQAGVAVATLNSDEFMAFGPNSGAWVVRDLHDGVQHLCYARLVDSRLKTVISDVLEKQPYVLGPGDRVRLILDFKGSPEVQPTSDMLNRCQAYYEKAITDNGYVLDPNGPISLTVSSRPGGQGDAPVSIVERPSKFNFRSRFNSNDSQPYAFPQAGAVPFHPVTHTVTFQRVEQPTPLWTTSESFWGPRQLTPQPGQTMEQAVKEYGGRTYQYYLGVTLPRRLPKPLKETATESYDPFAEK